MRITWTATVAAFSLFCMAAAVGCRPDTGLPRASLAGGATTPSGVDVVDYQVASSSMAPGLMGPALTAACTACGESFLVAAETARPHLTTRCFSCGGVCQLGTEVVPGQVVKVDLLDDTVPIERFDPIVFDAGAPPNRQVKRVWGLSGEQLAFRDGDLWVNGRRFTKSLEQLKQVAIPVALFPDDRRSHWELSTAGPAIAIEQVADSVAGQPAVELPVGSQLRWAYRRPARVDASTAPPQAWLEPSRIMDDYRVNQGVSRSLVAVDDYLLELRLGRPLRGRLRIGWLHGERWLEIQVWPETPSPRTENEGTSPSAQPPTERTSKSSTVHIACVQSLTLAVCDGRLLVRSDRDRLVGELHELWSRLDGSPPTDGGPAGSRLTIACDQQPAQIASLQVWRDQYLRVNDRHDSADQDLGSVPTQSYFVLGDNLPVSVDSRHELGFIQRTKMVGRVDTDPLLRVDAVGR